MTLLWSHPLVMLGAMDLVVSSPPIPGDELDVAAVARRAEAAGMDGLWSEDHLATMGEPARSGPVLAGAAIAATDRLDVGMAIFVPALRPLAWAASDIATLVALGHGRFQLGVGAGAGPPEEWAAAGVGRGSRWRRRDDFLHSVRPLLAGESVVLPDTGVPIRFAPAATPAPLWVGGPPERAAEHGAGWLPGLITPRELADGASRLRPGSPIAVVVHAALGGQRSDCAALLAARYGLEPTRADELAVGGTIEEVAAQLAPLVAAGAGRIAVVLDGGLSPQGIEALAAVGSLLEA